MQNLVLLLSVTAIAAGKAEFKEGQSIKCQPKPGAKVDQSIYRYSQGRLRVYPNAAIGASWNKNWQNSAIKVDCSKLTVGQQMAFNIASLGLLENDHVKCTNDKKDQDSTYRYTKSTLRKYASPDVLKSWVKPKKADKVVDCTYLTKGKVITAYEPLSVLKEGDAVVCELGSSTVYRYMNGKLHEYKSFKVRSFWENSNMKPEIHVDCDGRLVIAEKKLFDPPADEGRSIICKKQTGKFFRFTDGVLREYPDSTIGGSWDMNWNTGKSISCDIYAFGSPMELRVFSDDFLIYSIEQNNLCFDDNGATSVIQPTSKIFTALLSESNLISTCVEAMQRH